MTWLEWELSHNLLFFFKLLEGIKKKQAPMPLQYAYFRDLCLSNAQSMSHHRASLSEFKIFENS
jgi:hypothetical protein